MVTRTITSASRHRHRRGANPNGLTEFVVGSGGVGFQTMGPGIPNSVVRNADAFGVLKMTLHQSRFDWQFMPASGYSLTDSGTTQCHSAGVADTTAPTAPTSLSATASSASQVSLNWTAATDNVGVKSYNIYRGSNGATPQLIATTTTNATSFTDTTVTGAPYTYRVGARRRRHIGPCRTLPATTPTSTDTTPRPHLQPCRLRRCSAMRSTWADWQHGLGNRGERVQGASPAGESTLRCSPRPPNRCHWQQLRGHHGKPSSAYQYKVTAYDGAQRVGGLEHRAGQHARRSVVEDVHLHHQW